MARFEYSYPFPAVVGQEAAKQALLLCSISPAIGGVLLCGQKGTAKSTLVRGLARLLPDAPLVELPLNVTEDRLIGTLDVEAAIRTGRRRLQSGLLHRADGGFLYADEVNLLPEHIINSLLEAAGEGVIRVEREGLSITEPARFSLIGTMNPEEGGLRPQLLDRFGLYAEVHGEHDLEKRCEIIRRRLQYERDPMAFCQHWQKEEQALTQTLNRARALLPQVDVSPEALQFAAQLASEGGCAGHRAELVLCETARALAALEGQRMADPDHVRRAAVFALPHRLRQPVSLEEVPENTSPGEDSPHTDSTAAPDESDRKAAPLPPTEQCQPADELPPMALPFSSPRRLLLTGAGKRLKARSDTCRGRYVRSRLPISGKVHDIALDATLRSAMLHERDRDSCTFVTVRDSDLREKVRERRTGLTVLFLVDASGSMGARRRMGAVKGAILSLLKDAYQKRDTVGLVAFRGETAQQLLPLTRSVELAEKKLQTLSTGGKTPLEAGLHKAFAVLRQQRFREPHSAQLLVLVTDGHANMGGADPFECALKAAKCYASEPVQSLVLDTEQGFARFGLAKKLSEALNAEYLNLSSVTKSEIEQSVRSAIHF